MADPCAVQPQLSLHHDMNVWRFENGHVWRDYQTTPWRSAPHMLLTMDQNHCTNVRNEVIRHTSVIPDLATLVLSYLIGFTCEDDANQGASVGPWMQPNKDGVLCDLHDLMIPSSYHSAPFHPAPLAIPTPCCDSILFSAPLLRTDPRSLFLVYACIGSWLDAMTQIEDAQMLASLCIFGNSDNSVKTLLTLLVQSVPNQTGVIVCDPLDPLQINKIHRARCWLLDGMQCPPMMLQSICNGGKIATHVCNSTEPMACKGAVWIDHSSLDQIHVMSRFALSRCCTLLHFPEIDQAAPSISSTSSVTTIADSTASSSVGEMLTAELHVIVRKALMSWRVVRFYMLTHNIKTLWEVVARFDYFINSVKAFLVL